MSRAPRASACLAARLQPFGVGASIGAQSLATGTTERTVPTAALSQEWQPSARLPAVPGARPALGRACAATHTPSFMTSVQMTATDARYCGPGRVLRGAPRSERAVRARAQSLGPPPRSGGRGGAVRGRECSTAYCSTAHAPCSPCRTLNRLQPARCPASAKASVHAGAIGSQLVRQRKLVAPQSCTQTS